ncbi:MAG TPA: fumarylacetoacetate hydrolase family protein [Bauldia sp.]|nr:fumarylacetoacetate hydrolase family protein [Bauldia sp.]
MRFATLAVDGSEQAAVLVNERWVPLNAIDARLSGDLMALIASEPDGAALSDIGRRAVDIRPAIPIEAAAYRPPYRHPRKIWGIGLNYGDHAADLAEKTPEQPASFIKADHTIIGPGDDIVIPRQSERTTAEAELGLIFGKVSQSVPAARALDALFGVCVILDQTAEDILRINPRYLTRAKNFPGFFSFGPEVVTMDEFLSDQEIQDVVVATFVDGVEVRRNTIGNMTHGPAELVRFHTDMMPFFPGDIISSGTPGAGLLHDGAVAKATVSGLAPLVNPARKERG